MRFALDSTLRVLGRATGPRIIASAFFSSAITLGAPLMTARTQALPHLVVSPAIAPWVYSRATVEQPGIEPTSSCEGARALAVSPYGEGGLNTHALAAAYDLGPLYRTGDFGAGVTIALIEFARFRPGDVATFRSCIAAHVRPTTVMVDGGPASAHGIAGLAGQLEADIDVEETMALAPAAHIVVIEGSDATSTTVLDTYAAAVALGANVISTSWGYCEPSISSGFAESEAAIFERAATLGETVVAATGDEGSEACYDGKPSSAELAVEDPASQPLVTAVGGTTLVNSHHKMHQIVWNDGVAGGAGGGGVSTLWSMPSYQAPLASAASAAAPVGTCPPALGTCRGVPDVAADAGTPVLFYCTERGLCDGWSTQGGTSIAAPLWASIFALADANRACEGLPLGFVNPALYRIAAGPTAAKALTSIVSGDNNLEQLHAGEYSASAGDNLAIGLGSPLAGNGHDGRLIAQLCATPRATAGLLTSQSE